MNFSSQHLVSAVCIGKLRCSQFYAMSSDLHGLPQNEIPVCNAHLLPYGYNMNGSLWQQEQFIYTVLCCKSVVDVCG